MNIIIIGVPTATELIIACVKQEYISSVYIG